MTMMKQQERVCKWCMVPERVIERLANVEVAKYCVHPGGHEWVDNDRNDKKS
jgi:hypothetical protein